MLCVGWERDPAFACVTAVYAAADSDVNMYKHMEEVERHVRAAHKLGKIKTYAASYDTGTRKRGSRHGPKTVRGDL